MNQYLQAAQSAITAAQQDIDAQDAQLTNLSAQLQADLDQINLDNAQIVDLLGAIAKVKTQLAAAIAGGTALPSALLKQYTNIERMLPWTLVGGTAANTQQSGSKGTATMTSNPDQSVTIATQPSGAYYDAMFYRSLGDPPSVLLGLLLYRAEFMLDVANLPLSQGLEMDGSWYDGTYRYQPAMQIDMHSRTLRYYDPSIPDWVDTKIPITVNAGDWAPVEILGKVDRVAHTFTYFGVASDGVYHPLGITVKARPKLVANPFIHASVQLDSNSKGTPYAASIRRVSYAWL